MKIESELRGWYRVTRDVHDGIVRLFSVIVEKGCGSDLYINILPSPLARLLGVTHAFWVIRRYDEQRRESGS